MASVYDTPAASTLTRTSPGPGRGTSSSITVRTSGPPKWSTTTRFIRSPFPACIATLLPSLSAVRHEGFRSPVAPPSVGGTDCPQCFRAVGNRRGPDDAAGDTDAGAMDLDDITPRGQD